MHTGWNHVPWWSSSDYRVNWEGHALHMSASNDVYFAPGKVCTGQEWVLCERFCFSCETFCTYADKQKKETVHQRDVPERPMAKLGTDLFIFVDKQYMVTVDHYFNFTGYEIQTVIYKLNSWHCSVWKFTKDCNIEHVTSLPTFARLNGKAEQAVSIIAKTQWSKLKMQKRIHI